MLNVLLIGSGAREHALAKAFNRSHHPHQLHCFGSNYNPGIKQLCTDFKVDDLKKIGDIVHYANDQKIDLAIVGPELPLSLGVVDALRKLHIQVVGPTQRLAQIETSKGFARDLLNAKYATFLPEYRCFNTLTGIDDFLKKLGDAYVIKADGLMSGKGVKIAGEQLNNHQQALEYCQQIFAIGQSLVIEEKLVGQEFSLLSFSDGKSLIHMPPIQDYKRAFEHNQGPNTGGMGSYSNANHLLPFLNLAQIKEAQNLNCATVQALNDQLGETYQGILYGGFMVTKNGVKLIEYNARFGDPEAINLLALLETDLLEICQAIINNSLSKISVKFSQKATVCKYLVPSCYPDHPIQSTPIDISKVADYPHLYYAAVNEIDGKLYTTNSRALAILGIADDIKTASVATENIVQQIRGDLYHRTDIGL